MAQLFYNIFKTTFKWNKEEEETEITLDDI